MAWLIRGLRLVITGLMRLAFRLYFRSIRIQGLDRFPARGPVLLVANHPNSLIDPAILMTQLPRPIHFGAKHTLFQGPFAIVFEAFRAIPIVRAQDDRRAMGRNAQALKRLEKLMRDGHVAALFPEGLSQDEPHMAPAKSGAARIALEAEEATNFTLGVTIVPVGLQFEPRRRFRSDAFIRIGEPFTIGDNAARYAEDSRQAARALTDRIAAAIKQVAYHVDDPDRIPFVERLVDVYSRRAHQTGLGGVRGRAVRGELKQKMAACFNHYRVADPEAVAEVERELKRYERLREAAGLDRRLLEQPVGLLPGPLAPVQAAAEAFIGLVPALAGLLTSGPPYYITKTAANRIARQQDHFATLSLMHILVGAVVFPLFYGLEIAWVWSQSSDVATIWFGRLLVPTGLFAGLWVRRMRRLAVHVGGRVAGWMKLDAVARVAEAQRQLLARMDRMRDRYRLEVLGQAAPTARPRWRWKDVAIALLLAGAAVLAMFLYGLRNRPVAGLPQEPSPWQTIRAADPTVVTDRLERDARGTAAAITGLDRLEAQMRALDAEFDRGARTYYTQADQDAVHRLLLTYLNLRTALLRTVWTYRGAHDAPASGPFESRAFLLAYASAATLVEKADVIVTTFADDRDAQRALNAGDLAWDIPEGTYDRLRASLANPTVAAELSIAIARFDTLRESRAFPDGAAWPQLVEAAAVARPSVLRTVQGVPWLLAARGPLPGQCRGARGIRDRARSARRTQLA